MTDPEDVTRLHPKDLEEVEVDETDDAERPHPIEADPADVAEQRSQLDIDIDDEDEHEARE